MRLQLYSKQHFFSNALVREVSGVEEHGAEMVAARPRDK